METITYKPHPGRQRMLRVFGIVFGLFGGGMGCLSFFAGIFILLVTLGSDTDWQEVWPMVLMFSGGGLFMAIIFMAFGAVFGLGGGNEQLELTDQALIYTKGKKMTTLPLTAITQLTGERRGSHTGKSGHWVVVIRDQFGSSIELDVAQGAYLATFDVLPILQELLPRLPTTINIDTRVQGYVSSGRMTR